MAEITRKRSGELIRGVFKLLLNHPEGLPAKDVLKQLETEVPPTPFEASAYPSNPKVRRYERIVRFSTIVFVKAGWLVKEKGQWSVSDDGRKAYDQFADPDSFMQEARSLYSKWAKARPEDETSQETEIIEDAANAIATLEEAEEEAWAEIEAHLAVLSPYDFQNLVAGLLQGMGYHVAWVSPPGADRGIDIIAHTEPLGITGPRIKVQVKRRPAERTAVDGVRSFMATLGNTDVGLFVSSGGFTKDAEDLARHQETRRVMLVDLKRMFGLWVEHYERIPEEQRRLLPLKKVYFLADEE